jgi:hypothetical protein
VCYVTRVTQKEAIVITLKQLKILSLFTVLLWVLATAAIRYFPGSFTNSVAGNIGFVASIPIGWVCVRAARRWAELAREQLVAGTAFVVALAMLIDASALRWMHAVYSTDDAGSIFRLGSAWLLWGYGVSLAIALAMARRRSEEGALHYIGHL